MSNNYGGDYGQNAYGTPYSAPTPPAVPDPVAQAQRMQILQAMRRARSGGNWFYWIAGLSLVNSILALTSSRFAFVIGLGVMQLIDGVGQALAQDGTKAAPIFALVADLLVAGLFVLFGYLAGQRQTWAFIVGMVLYTLDGLLLLAAGDLPSVAFHGYALFWMFTGMQANMKIRAWEQAARQATALPLPAYGPPPGPPNPYR
ncbi:MAG TPA: hypothetical protein VKY74_12850 [Chloroflexia bacterium]|nr:hypothetical protein [Chloroflexia bacterium]